MVLTNPTTLRGFFSCHGTSVAPDIRTCNSVLLVENKGVSMKTLRGATGRILSLSGLVELSDERLDAFTITNSTVNKGKKTPRPTRAAASRTRHAVTHAAIVHTVLFPKWL